MKSVLFLFFVITFVLLAKANACSCAGWDNAYHAALQKHSIVAKVSTFSITNSIATLNVQKVYKGSVPRSQIKVLGQDGGNCNGQILNSRDSWIVIFSKNQKGGYETLMCADTALSIHTSNKEIRFQLSGSFGVTESQFKDMLALKLTPSIKGIQCNIHASRMATGYNDPSLELEFYESAFNNDATPTELAVDYDLSGLSSGLKNLNFYVGVYQKDSRNFDVWARLDEPFYSGSYNTNHSVDITQTYSIANVGYNKFIDQNGDGIISDDEPYFSMATSAICQFKAGKPLVKLAR